MMQLYQHWQKGRLRRRKIPSPRSRSDGLIDARHAVSMGDVYIVTCRSPQDLNNAHREPSCRNIGSIALD
ncbi:hypothetical protein CY34DRAFT_807247 [Suillus luteus UH-Slu-Lm8-n1]|uniref:Uncharacterized protein n=1 Tax=Suillus luteus UH-Slu-Lm8-n1 TaxID=930992 RepID=A0A0D0B9N5_9AGAM|nr:hypothetical protein CY34DRAFT_807247 [Suillus luteus UH-Slu-Lm8-n1]